MKALENIHFNSLIAKILKIPKHLTHCSRTWKLWKLELLQLNNGEKSLGLIRNAEEPEQENLWTDLDLDSAAYI